MVGNIPNFSKYDILRCFLRLNDNLGRQELAKELDLGEGTIRSILGILKNKKFLDSTKKGHFLSKEGARLMAKIIASVPEFHIFKLDYMYGNLIKFGIVLKNSKISSETYKLRDMAVKNGADGAVIFEFSDKLKARGEDYLEYFKEIEKKFSMKKGDILIVTFADEIRHAELGAYAIAANMNEELNNFLKEVD